MTDFGVFAALLAALCLGYRLGRRSGAGSPTWRTATSRLTAGRLAINLLFVLTARRVRRKRPVRRMSGVVQLLENACWAGADQRRRALPARQRTVRRTRVDA